MKRIGRHKNVAQLCEVLELIQDTKSTMRKFFSELVSDIAYCHANGITHRDLNRKTFSSAQDQTGKRLLKLLTMDSMHIRHSIL